MTICGKCVLVARFLQAESGHTVVLLAVLATHRRLLRSACNYASSYEPLNSLPADVFEEYWTLAESIFSYIAPFLVQRALVI